jgi:deoxyribodipyrimidine photo-lyase
LESLGKNLEALGGRLVLRAGNPVWELERLLLETHAEAWRAGEQYFMQKLVDGDIAANNGGWQWSAGTGADAAPYFRIQNPWAQTSRYDPSGRYIKTWIPELRDVDPARLAKPPSTRLANDYPPPIVDHAKERQNTLERFHRARQAA